MVETVFWLTTSINTINCETNHQITAVFFRTLFLPLVCGHIHTWKCISKKRTVTARLHTVYPSLTHLSRSISSSWSLLSIRHMNISLHTCKKKLGLNSTNVALKFMDWLAFFNNTSGYMSRRFSCWCYLKQVSVTLEKIYPPFLIPSKS